MSHQTSENRNWKIIFSALFVDVGWILFWSIMVMALVTQANQLLELVIGFVAFSVCMLPFSGLYILLIHSPYGLSQIRWRSGAWSTLSLRLYLCCLAIVNVLVLMLSMGVIISVISVNFQGTIKELLELDILWVILSLFFMLGGGALVHIFEII